MSADSGVMLITGARKGIGRYLAEYYLSKGWQVIGCSRTQADPLPGAYRHFRLDVSDEPAVKAMFAAVRKDYGKLDALINNAGIASMNHALLMPVPTLQNILNTNVVGTFLFCREAAKLMQRQKAGRIVNFSTIAVPLNLEGESAYAASKAAIESLTRTLARELSEMGITVNALGPTPIKTDLIHAVPEEKMQHLIERQAIRRYGEFSDVSNVIDFFLRPESSFITGQVMYLGGVS
jgi:3-oxoacyl-[acyl-carrier protein] reductase